MSNTVYKASTLLSVLKQNVFSKNSFHRQVLSNSAIQKKRIGFFEREKKRQSALHTNIEKITVTYKGNFDDDVTTLIMNKHISTPYDCFKHLSQLTMEQAVVAEVNGEIWDLNQPLEEDCELELLHFKETDPYYVNKAFWRSCSIMFGCMLETVFKDNHHVDLCSFPRPDVRSGSFIYDAAIENIESWHPTRDDMRALSSSMVKIGNENHYFERLDVDAKIAMTMFEDNKFKSAQIPHIAATSPSGTTVTLYRLKDFIEISRGPLMGRTGHMGRCTVTSLIPFEADGETLYRVQGVALPHVLRMNHFSYSILEDRARKLNLSATPTINQWQLPPNSDEYAEVQ